MYPDPLLVWGLMLADALLILLLACDLLLTIEYNESGHPACDWTAAYQQEVDPDGLSV